VPYRDDRRGYVIVGGQRVVPPNFVPQRLPWCDKCDTLAANNATRFTELAPDKRWKWFSYPKFLREDEAFMGCANHPVESLIYFLDGRVEPFIRLPLTRWQRLTEKDALIVASVLAVVFAVIIGLLLKLLVGL
jgi:hypothetical protein